jgi:hypothetical protein
MGQASDLNDLLALYQELEEGAEPPQERREHPRAFAKGHVPATLEIGGAMPVTVSVRDMSRSGIGVIGLILVKAGEQVVVSFRLRGGAVRARCRVANCREEEGGRYVIGMAFEEVSRAKAGGVPGPATAGGGGVAPADGLAGECVPAMQVVAGADVAHVDDVVKRLGRAIHTSS